MATLIFSAAGAALGAKFGGTLLGLSGMVIGRAIGATLGRLVDQRLLGAGSSAVETGRIDRLRVTGAGEGVPLARVWGRMRIAGHVIWASGFTEVPGASHRPKGKLGPRVEGAPGYRVSLAIALCEGRVSGIGRIWADGQEIRRRDLNLRLHLGDDMQMPDPRIEAAEGAGRAPAYRGTAYVMLEDLDLTPFGNRIPSFNFEVIRAAEAPGETTLQEAVRAVAWLPGSGEYALASSPVSLRAAPTLGALRPPRRIVNQNTPAAESDFLASLEALGAELPQVGSGLLVVSWFGSDLRCGECRVQPKVEAKGEDSQPRPWRVAGLTRSAAEALPRLEGAPVYGGTPADFTVIEAIRAMDEAGQKVVYYPFLLMDQLAGNDLPDPWSGAGSQPTLPWRGRITLSVAPGRAGTPDLGAGADAEVAAFFGTAAAADFTVAGEAISYSGPDEWSYRRFILHQAALCVAAGGVDAFCIGSEMVALTRIRGAEGGFPAVAQMVALLVEVRALMGPDVKLIYAADWSEYWGCQTEDGGRYFHLDPLWSHPDLDVIGIDNYMPLADWRDGDAHLDRLAGVPSPYDLTYLKHNIAGGEGFEWFYASEADRAAQIRTPISDAGEQEPWVWRYKDLRSFWELVHYDRVAGVRAAEPTPWVPRSKPVWFTELGCAAIDKGANQPNRFLDPKSSESALPFASNGGRDDLMQMQYLRAQAEYWQDPANNPVSELYGGPMLDWSRAHVWAWDARPWPWFPANAALWSDGPNWWAGHWLTGRAANQPLGAVVAEICAAAGLGEVDVSALHGVLRGYRCASTDSPRAALQPLMTAYGIEAYERGGRLVFRPRAGEAVEALDPARLVAGEGGAIALTRAAHAETAGRVRLVHIAAEADFAALSAEAVIPDEAGHEVISTELSLALLPSEAEAAVRRWLAEARVARDTTRFALPPSSDLGPGDVVALPGPEGAPRHYRIDRLALAGAREVEAVRVEPGIWQRPVLTSELVSPEPYLPDQPLEALWLELPMMREAQVPQAPFLALRGRPWPGAVAVYEAAAGSGSGAFAFNSRFTEEVGFGQSLTDLAPARAGLWQQGAGLEVELPGAALVSHDPMAVLEGANLLALGDGTNWELISYAGAELIGPERWRLCPLLRAGFGTGSASGAGHFWPAGSLAVPVDGRLGQIVLPLSQLRRPRLWRFGPAMLAPDAAAYEEEEKTFDGVGLRPYAPCHLRASAPEGGALAGGVLHLGWIRRSRIGGDSWEGWEVPLGEEREAYRLRILVAGVERRVVETEQPAWIYTAAARLADGSGAGFEIRVAQVSALYGPGREARLVLAG